MVSWRKERNSLAVIVACVCGPDVIVELGAGLGNRVKQRLERDQCALYLKRF